MTTRARVRAELVRILEANPSATNNELWDLTGAETLGIARSTFGSKYALKARRKLGIARKHPARPLKMKTPKRPERELPPPAKWVPPPGLRGPVLNAKELAKERRMYLKRREQRQQGAA